MIPSLRLCIAMVTKEKTEINNATTGKYGYQGTLKGRNNCGSFLLNCNNAIIETMYRVSAPKTEMVMISEVLPVSNATIPINIFISKALAGVRKRG